VRKIFKSLVVERKQLGQLAAPGLVAGVRAVGDEPCASGEGLSYGYAGGKPSPLIRTPLKPPPPYCSERSFHSTGKVHLELDRRRVGSIWPRTLQNAGLAGEIRAAGVGARSETESGEGACSAAESIRTACSAGPARPPQLAAGSPSIVVARAEAVTARIASAPIRQNAHLLIRNRAIAASRLLGLAASGSCRRRLPFSLNLR
jgi:hypothetical protein